MIPDATGAALPRRLRDLGGTARRPDGAALRLRAASSLAAQLYGSGAGPGRSARRL